MVIRNYEGIKPSNGQRPKASNIGFYSTPIEGQTDLQRLL